MNTLVIYDSVYGNTEKIAQTIGDAIQGDVKVVRPGEMAPSMWEKLDILIIGSPTQGGRATQVIQDVVTTIPEPILKGINIATFDTRITTKLVGIFGYAATRLANSLISRGGNLVIPAEGFFVKGRGGPLKEGELERADLWSKAIQSTCYNRVLV